MSDLKRFLATVSELTQARDEVPLAAVGARLNWSEARLRSIAEHAYDDNLLEADAEFGTGVVTVDGLTPLGRLALLS